MLPPKSQAAELWDQATAARSPRSGGAPDHDNVAIAHGTGLKSPFAFAPRRPGNICSYAELAFRLGNDMPLQTESPGPLAGHRVLVVEDEYFLADDIVRTLTALGARIVGPYGDLHEATSVVNRGIAIDAAIMDINLRDEMVFPLARMLRSRKVPLVFTTGYDRGALEPEFQDVKLWGKPLDLKAMARELTKLIRGS
jgi:CheY-like chemotaxis protein